MRVEKATWFKDTYEKVSSNFVHDSRLTAVEQVLALRIFGRDSGHYPELTPESAIALLHPEDQPEGHLAWDGLVEKGYLFYVDGDWTLVDPELEWLTRKCEAKVKASGAAVPKLCAKANAAVGGGGLDMGGGLNGHAISHAISHAKTEPQAKERETAVATLEALGHVKATDDLLPLTEGQWRKKMAGTARDILQGGTHIPFQVADLPEIEKGHIMYRGALGHLGAVCLLYERHAWNLWGSVMVCVYCNLHHRECGCPGEHCRSEPEA